MFYLIELIFGSLGRYVINYFSVLGKSVLILFNSIYIDNFSKFLSSIWYQIYFVGVLSLIIVIISGLFVGMVLGVQGVNILIKFDAEQLVGEMIGLTLIRELGPVITALLFAGRVGSALTAEISLMRITQQLSSIEMMGINSLKTVIGPRFWACQICLPLLSIIFNVSGLLGGYIICVKVLKIDSGMFWLNMQLAVDFKKDVLNGIIKSIVFSFFISWIAIFKGVSGGSTVKNLGMSITDTVVYSYIFVFILNFFLTGMVF